MLNFSKFCTFFHLQGSYSGFGCMPKVSSGRRRNLVSPLKYCDHLLLGSHPYVPFSLSCFFSLWVRSSPICPSWSMYLLLQPCLGIALSPFCKKIHVYKMFMVLWRQLAIFCLVFSFLFLLFRDIYRILLCGMTKFGFKKTWSLLLSVFKIIFIAIVIVSTTIVKWWKSVRKSRHKQCLNVTKHKGGS